MYNIEPLVLENMILHIIKDIKTLQYYENIYPNWMNRLFNAIKNKEFPFTSLDPNLYDLYKVFIMNDLMSNFNIKQIQNINYEFIKKTYFD